MPVFSLPPSTLMSIHPSTQKLGIPLCAQLELQSAYLHPVAFHRRSSLPPSLSLPHPRTPAVWRADLLDVRMGQQFDISSCSFMSGRPRSTARAQENAARPISYNSPLRIPPSRPTTLTLRCIADFRSRKGVRFARARAWLTTVHTGLTVFPPNAIKQQQFIHHHVKVCRTRRQRQGGGGGATGVNRSSSRGRPPMPPYRAGAVLRPQNRPSRVEPLCLHANICRSHLDPLCVHVNNRFLCRSLPFPPFSPSPGESRDGPRLRARNGAWKRKQRE